jgi:hypothetical protein
LATNHLSFHHQDQKGLMKGDQPNQSENIVITKAVTSHEPGSLDHRVRQNHTRSKSSVENRVLATRHLRIEPRRSGLLPSVTVEGIRPTESRTTRVVQNDLLLILILPLLLLMLRCKRTRHGAADIGKRGEESSDEMFRDLSDTWVLRGYSIKRLQPQTKAQRRREAGKTQ